MNRVGVLYSAFRVLPIKMWKPDLCEPSNCRHESQVTSDIPPFLEKKLLVQSDSKYLSQNSRCSFWYHLGACRQHRSRVNFI
jgi:hypothetical protein